MTNQLTEELVYWDMVDPPSDLEVVDEDDPPEDETTETTEAAEETFEPVQD